MKLTLTPISFTFKRPIVAAYGRIAERRGLRVTLETDGFIGRGEAMPLPEFGTESLEACQRALAAFVVERAPASIAEIEPMTESLKATPAARSAAEGALLEHLSRRTKISISQLLGGSKAQSIQVNALIDGDDARGLAAAAKAAVEAGFSTVKVKVGAHPLGIDAQRLMAVRNAVGPNVRLRIDANGGWSESTARAALRGLEALNLELCEQPVVSHDVESMRRIRQAVPCRIAADEVLLVPDASTRVLDVYPVPAAQVLVLKPMVLGGVLPALALAKRAREVAVDSYVTTSLDGPIARAAAAMLASVVSGPYAHGVSTLELFEGVAADRFTPVNGAIRAFDEPGWGV